MRRGELRVAGGLGQAIGDEAAALPIAQAGGGAGGGTIAIAVLLLLGVVILGTGVASL